jgi:hypothetical protein
VVHDGRLLHSNRRIVMKIQLPIDSAALTLLNVIPSSRCLTARQIPVPDRQTKRRRLEGRSHQIGACPYAEQSPRVP